MGCRESFLAVINSPPTCTGWSSCPFDSKNRHDGGEPILKLLASSGSAPLREIGGILIGETLSPNRASPKPSLSEGKKFFDFAEEFIKESSMS